MYFLDSSNQQRLVSWSSSFCWWLHLASTFWAAGWAWVVEVPAVEAWVLVAAGDDSSTHCRARCRMLGQANEAWKKEFNLDTFFCVQMLRGKKWWKLGCPIWNDSFISCGVSWHRKYSSSFSKDISVFWANVLHQLPDSSGWGTFTDFKPRGGTKNLEKPYNRTHLTFCATEQYNSYLDWSDD